MKVLPLDQLRFGWRSHLSALWWLLLLYRRPVAFGQSSQDLSALRTVIVGLTLLCHLAPWLLTLFLIAQGMMGFQPWRVEGNFGWFISVRVGLAVLIGSFCGVIGSIVDVIGSRLLLNVRLGVFYGTLVGTMACGLLSIVIGLATVLDNARTVGIEGGIAFGVLFGTTFGMFSGIMLSVTSRSSSIQILLTFSVALGAVFAAMVSVRFGIALSVGFGVAMGVTSLRVYYLPLGFCMTRRWVPGEWYRYHPAAWDHMCRFPYWGLDRLLVAYHDHNPIAGRAEIERLIDTYPTQRTEALKAKTILVAREAGRLKDLSQLTVTLAGLPEGDRGFLKQVPQLRELAAPVADRQRQFDRAKYPTVRRQLAELLLQDIHSFRDQIAGFDEPLRTEFRTAALRWADHARTYFADALNAAPAVKQVFRAGDPIDRNEMAFVTRDGVIGEVERQVLLATGCPGLILYGRRRMGKSTVLRNFTGFLPASVAVATVSMQDPLAFTSLGVFVSKIAEVVQVARDWAGALPAGSPETLPDLMRFLSACDRHLSARGERLLLALDEYENIDAKIGEGVFPLDLLATVRESIQSHRHVTWVFAGSHATDELVHAPWSSYLISARTVEVLPFTLKETHALLTDPMRYSDLWRSSADKRPRFDPAFWGVGGIERVHADAGGWPHLVQLLAEQVIDRVNLDGVTEVSDDLYQQVLSKVIVRGHDVFSQLVKGESRLPGEWEYVSAFRRTESQPPPADDEVYRSLKRRLLVAEGADGWRLRVPLMRLWLRERG